MSSQMRHYQAVLWEVIQARGEDAELALKVWCQWEFEALCEQALAIEIGTLGPQEIH